MNFQNNDLIDYYENIVIPTLEEFNQDKTNIRKAKLALITMFHVTDYIKINKKIRIKDLYDGCTELSSLRDAANVTKHCRLTLHNPTITNINQIKQKTSPGLFQAPFGEGVFAEANEVYLVFDEQTNKDITLVSKLLSTVNIYLHSVIYN